MVEVWARNLFICPGMIKWNERPDTHKDYRNAVAYFTKHLVATENVEAAGRGALKQQGFEAANAVADIQTECVNQRKENRVKVNRERHKIKHEMAT